MQLTVNVIVVLYQYVVVASKVITSKVIREFVEWFSESLKDSILCKKKSAKCQTLPIVTVGLMRKSVVRILELTRKSLS